jgi:hypothetical protein
LARIEHQVAADHHSALASMYAQRAAWLEQELSNSVPRFGAPLRGVASDSGDGAKRGAETIVALSRAPRTGSVDVM